MNIKQTLVIIFLMMFCVSFVPRANAEGYYYCSIAANDFNEAMDSYRDYLDQVNNLKKIMKRKSNTLADKKHVAEGLKRLLRTMTRMADSSRDYESILGAIYEIRKACSDDSQLKRIIRENDDRLDWLRKEHSYWIDVADDLQTRIDFEQADSAGNWYLDRINARHKEAQNEN